MELTKEYLNKALATQTATIKKEITQVESRLAHMTAKGFEDIQSRLDVSSRVEILERQMSKVGIALNAKL